MALNLRDDSKYMSMSKLFCRNADAYPTSRDENRTSDMYYIKMRTSREKFHFV